MAVLLAFRNEKLGKGKCCRARGARRVSAERRLVLSHKWVDTKDLGKVDPQEPEICNYTVVPTRNGITTAVME